MRYSNCRNRMYVIFIGILISLHVMAAPDYDREARWASEIVPSLIVGEPIYLTQKNQHRFLGIYANQDKPRLGVVLVHGMGLHPDWGFISTLRQQLYDSGYTTLSIQMPVLAADAPYTAYPALFPDAVERLQLAVAYLVHKGYKRIAIVSHSNGSRMTRVYMATNPSNVIAWASLSLTQGDSFEGIKAPILDLYGEKDLPHVLSSVAKRKASLLNPASRQQYILGADHFFTGHEGEVVTDVKDFLDRMLIAQLNRSYTGAMAPLYCASWE